MAKKYQLILDMQPGAMTFVNNWAIVHSRDPFEVDETHVIGKSSRPLILESSLGQTTHSKKTP